MANVTSQYFLGNELLNNNKYKIVVKGFNGRGRTAFSVEGITTTEFSLAASNNFSNVDNDARSAANTVGLGSVVAAKDIGSTLTSVASGTDRFVTRLESTEAWKGPNKPEFQVDLLFVCQDSKDPKESVISKANALMAMVYPAIGSTAIGEVFDSSKGFTFEPPLGYTSSNGDRGKITLAVGDYFIATKLICRSVSFTFSREVNSEGEPIFATGAITVTPFRAITYGEYLNYFPKARRLQVEVV